MINMARYNKAVAITPSDSIDFTSSGKGSSGQANLSDAIYVGGAGNLVVVFQDGTAITFAVIAGQILPVAARRINASSTTATLLFALYQI